MASIVLLFAVTSVYCQFYNGHQIKFGKNRVQYDNFEWYYYRYPRYDTYFYTGGSDLAEKTAKIAESNIGEIETLLDHKLKKRIIFVIYQNLSDFRQSNIGLVTDANEYNIGGTFKVIDNIAFIYTERGQKEYGQQIKAAITSVILNEMIYGEKMRNQIANNTLIKLPEWYVSGLVAYISKGWDCDIDNYNKIKVLEGKCDKINNLTGGDAEIAGSAIWNYISRIYGRQVISNIVYMTQITKSVSNGFMYVLGSPLAVVQQNATDYYKTQYENFNSHADIPQAENQLKKSRKNVVYQQVQYSSNTDKLAWAENKLGRYWIKTKDLQSGKVSKVLRREHMLDQIVDYSYPIIKWHPSGKMLGYVIEKKGQIYFVYHNLETKERREIEMAALEKINSFDYSNDGQKLVIGGFNNGQSDIFIFDIGANTIENITNDIADDYNPLFVNLSSQIIFESNRKSAKLGNKQSAEVDAQPKTDIFVYDLKSKTIEQITSTPNDEESQPYKFGKDIYYLSDECGNKNLYKSQLDSAVSFVDTITHYRYNYNVQKLTNYQYNINEVGYDKFSDNTVFAYRTKDGFSLFKNGLLSEITDEGKITTNKKIQNAEAKKHEELSLVEEIPQVQEDPNRVDVNNYSFDRNVLEQYKIQETKSLANAKKQTTVSKYLTTFYTNYLVSQVDFSYLTTSYQKFTGSAFYFNPGLNLVFKIGTSDLFEDYRIGAGFRWDLGGDGNEYLLTFENLKHRLNHQLILHRQAISDYDYYYTKTLTHEAFYIIRYPFSQVDAMQFTANIRQNKSVFLSVSDNTLTKPDEFDYWASIKAEYIFDNSKEITTNILSGVRFKMFAEAFMQLDKKKSDMAVVGADFRYYVPIHRNFIFATRVATSASFGHAKLLYYLGGVDNWINLSSRHPMFNTNIKIDPNINYTYQAVATNMRGFSQNIRNGTNFAVVNAELRFPVISYFSKKPINNSFLKNLQVIGFFDAGMAWSGLNPFDGDNAYENDYYENYPVTIILKNNNNPLVAGYGFGVRSKILGYFVRADWAWGIDSGKVQPMMFYLSLSLDF